MYNALWRIGMLSTHRLIATLTVVVTVAVTAHSALPATEDPSSVQILSLYAYPAETSANKLSGVFPYPDVRFVNAVLEVDLRGFTGERKFSVFLTVSDDKGVIEKEKAVYTLSEGAYKFDFPHVLDLKKQLGRKKLKLFAEVNLSGAPIVTSETFFEIRGREPPKVTIEAFTLYPERWEQEDYIYPGTGITANLFLSVDGLEERERLRLRVVGVVEDEGAFKIDPESKYPLYDSAWEEGQGPRGDGRYVFIFTGTTPGFFYDFGRYEHPFTIHVLFYLEDEIVQRARIHGEIYVRDPGSAYQTNEEELRVIQISPSSRWRLRRIPEDYEIEDRPTF